MADICDAPVRHPAKPREVPPNRVNFTFSKPSGAAWGTDLQDGLLAACARLSGTPLPDMATAASLLDHRTTIGYPARHSLLYLLAVQCV